MKLNKSTLEERRASYIKKLNDLGRYTYIEGYKGYRFNVKVKHNKCGNVIEGKAEVLLRMKNNDVCSACSKSSKYKTLDEIQDILIQNGNENIKVIGIDTTNTRRKVYVLKCECCNNTYKISYNQIKNNLFSCCKNDKGSLYDRHTKHQSEKILREFAPKSYLFGEKLVVYVEDYVSKLSYIKNNTFDKRQFVIDVYYEIMCAYLRRQIAICECCKEPKKGIEWGVYKNYYEYRICHSCVQKQKRCSSCLGIKKQKKFNFDYENRIFNDKCIECE